MEAVEVEGESDSYGWKFLVGGAESVRDSKDLLKSNKIWPPVTVMDVPCGFTAHMDASTSGSHA